jgi:hypothetical protein
MFHLGTVEETHRTIHDHVLMNVALFVASTTPPEKTHVPRWIVATVPDAAAKENEVAVQVKRRLGHAVGIAVNDGPDALSQLGGDSLVPVDEEHPSRLEWKGVKRPVLLTSITLPIAVNDLGTRSAGDLDRIVIRPRVDNPHLSSPPRDRGKRVRKVNFLVTDDHHDFDVGSLAAHMRVHVAP